MKSNKLSRPKSLKSFLWILVLLPYFILNSFSNSLNPPSILVFSKTEGFRHQSIDAGKNAFAKMSQSTGTKVEFTEDADHFVKANLKKYNAVVFLNTTGDVLNEEQQIEFEKYIQAGGGYLGIHAASDTEYSWPWYGGLVGAYFLDHPNVPSNVQEGKFKVEMQNHWATMGMSQTFMRKDEFYSFKNISPKINVVLSIDESTYQGGSNGDYHPMSWYQEYDGGRSFYTAMGHTDETFEEDLFLKHLWAGLDYVVGGENPEPLDYTKSRPEENRFSKVILAEKLNEPMELTVLDENLILFVERKGAVRLYNIKTKELKTIADIPVSTKYVNADGEESEAEDGLMGLSKDPNFAKNGWIYVYYSDPKESRNILVRYTLNKKKQKLKSKKILLEVPTQREECCHTGGSIAWDADGNLYLSTGDNTNPHGSSGYSPSDERPGRSPWDAQKSSANTNDLRGKILRIKPTKRGYEIPQGNLFAEGMPKTRPEIYTMGHRNPFRISVDQKTGYLYWGDVGPDARESADDRGPQGQDEVGQAKKAGNYGWPHFIGDNKAYHKYNFEEEISLPKWDPLKPINKSPNNTGLAELPPAQNAFIWYPYEESPEFPIVGTGGRNAMAGPVFYSEDFVNAQRSFPKYYDGKLLTYDWMRGWFMSVTMDENGDLDHMEKFMPSYKFSNPMDVEFHPSGDLYMLEYGTGWFTGNDDARLVRIEYNKGNRKPILNLVANKMGGSIPLDLSLSAEGSTDADKDMLQYSWQITSANGFNKTLKGEKIDINLDEIGKYKVTLSADDGNGGISERSIDIMGGNEPPVVAINLNGGNKSFYFNNTPISYEVNVSDLEDGSTASGQISKDQVSFNVNYLAEGFDKIEIAQGHKSSDDISSYSKGMELISKSDCQSCHKKSEKSIGPSYSQIADKYKSDVDNVNKITTSIIKGSSQQWGDFIMPPHVNISEKEAIEIADYIININSIPEHKPLDLTGTYIPKTSPSDGGKGIVVMRAAYEDKGASGLESLKSIETLTLNNAKIPTHNFNEYVEINKMSFNGMDLIIPTSSGAHMKLENVDMTGITAVDINGSAMRPQLNAVGAVIQFRIGSPDGEIIGESDFFEPTDEMGTMMSATQIDINPTEGEKDLYLVFTNPEGKQGALMVVTGIEFKSANVNQEAKNAMEDQVVEKVDLTEYVGKYKMTGMPFEFIEVSTENDQLIVFAGSQGGPVAATNKKDQFDANGQAILLFQRNDNNEVISIDLEAMGMKFNGAKVIE